MKINHTIENAISNVTTFMPGEQWKAKNETVEILESLKSERTALLKIRDAFLKAKSESEDGKYGKRIFFHEQLVEIYNAIAELNNL
jgi:hypothetical protein